MYEWHLVKLNLRSPPSWAEGGPTEGGPTEGGPTEGGPTEGGPTEFIQPKVVFTTSLAE